MELKAYLSVLLLRGLSFKDELVKFQEELKKRFNKEYTIQEIDDELTVIKLEQDNNYGYIKEYPEDFELRPKR